MGKGERVTIIAMDVDAKVESLLQILDYLAAF